MSTKLSTLLLTIVGVETVVVDVVPLTDVGVGTVVVVDVVPLTDVGVGTGVIVVVVVVVVDVVIFVITDRRWRRRCRREHGRRRPANNPGGETLSVMDNTYASVGLRSERAGCGGPQRRASAVRAP